MAVRPRPVGGVDVGLDRALGARLARLGRVLAVLQPARVVDVPGRGDRRHRGELRRPTAARRRCTSRASRPTARRATSTRPRRRSSGPDLQPVEVAPRPGRAGRLRGAARRARLRAPTRVRITQTRPGTSPLGRTVGLVAPTAAEYRLLGANEPFLAALRTATGGARDRHAARPVAPRPRSDDPRSPTCGRCCSCWRCCCGRSTSRCGASRSAGASSRRPVPGSGGLPNRRPADGRRGRRPARACSRHAARAASAETRARVAGATAPAAAAAVDRTAVEQPSAPVTPTACSDDAPAVRLRHLLPRRRPPPAPPATATPPPPADTMARLRDAKRRARER